MLVRRSLLFMKQYLSSINMHNEIRLPNIAVFDQAIIIEALNFMYGKYHLNDMEFYTIGGDMEYCVFSNNAVIETNI